MKAAYTVKQGQNLFDVAVQIHGSIEGVFDLLISNDIDMDGTIHEGDELVYHTEYIQNTAIVSELKSQGTVVANGSGYSNYKLITSPQNVLLMFIVEPVEGIDPTIRFKGSGSVDFYWGNRDYTSEAQLSKTIPVTTAPSFTAKQYTLYVIKSSPTSSISSYDDSKVNVVRVFSIEQTTALTSFR